MIFNEGAYLTFKSIFHKTLNLFLDRIQSRSNPNLEPTSTNVNHARIRSCNQPVLM